MRMGGAVLVLLLSMLHLINRPRRTLADMKKGFEDADPTFMLESVTEPPNSVMSLLN
jgi:hypothetical protein